MNPIFNYKGQIHVRPIGRGVTLEAEPYNGNQHLEDTLPEGHHYAEITVYKEKPPERPTIVCLCGSTRFWRTFQQAGLEETMAGRIVLSIGAASGTDDDHFGNLPKSEYDRIKEELDQLHLRKIEMADQVLILNVNNYIGESTARELAHAKSLGKQIRFWTEEHPEY